MKVLYTGAGGQLGYELGRSVPPGWQALGLDRRALDITDADAVAAAVTAERPQVVINAAAYTAVDKAEGERALAFAVNADGAGHLARAAAAAGARFIQVSTDFVFDGAKSSPYRPGDPARALGVYGESKLAGERLVQAALGDATCIVRSAWVYSAHGHNFVKTILRLARERDGIAVVADQVGTPTWARGLAEALWRIAADPARRGVWHWTDAGVASWYDFAVAVVEEGERLGLLAHAVPVRPITTAEYPTPARRPAYSVLDKSDTWRALGVTAPHWRSALLQMLAELKDNTDA